MNASISLRKRSTAEASPERLTALAGPLLALFLQGCVLALGPQHHVSGAELPAWLEPLRIGSTEQQLVTLYGPPTSRQPGPGKLVDLQWTEVLRPRGCRTYLFAVIPLNRDPRLTRRVLARLDDGRLVSASVTYIDRHGTTTSTESLVQKSDQS